MENGFTYEDYFGQKSHMSYYEEIKLSEFAYNEITNEFSYPCPCGDVFVITEDELRAEEQIARCQSCSLIVLVLYDTENITNILENIKTNKKM